eukprot:TRINITY_DN5341_c0_g1_i13.p1 TRINITY_DN5341_c0_g1~~TRINITY_DN5341_c0_g1_i13.p1  ORF type:complete len:210 (-),score=58.23 TRINITY_DN5341_c0_g1_i13:107-736(-)
MSNDAFEEVEMQTYSLSYSYPETYPSQLPYHWDGDCHLTLNQSFYSPWTEALAADFTDQLDLEEEKEDLDFPFEPDPSSPLAMDCEDSQPQRTESVVSVSTLSTDATNGNQMGETMETIDEQIEFILDSVKKQRKPVPKKAPVEKKKGLTRKRKTTDQLQLLQKEVSEAEAVDRGKIRELAERTGLNVSQVYKWYWDFKRKQSDQPAAC